MESSGLRPLAECNQSIVGSFTKLSMYEVSNFFDDLNVRKLCTIVFVINPVVPSGAITLTKCGDKRNGINSGIVESLVPAPNAKLKSIPVADIKCCC